MPDVRPGWTVKDGILTIRSHAITLSSQKFWNFSMDVEYRILPRSNSGSALALALRTQLYDDRDRLLPSGSVLSWAIAPTLMPATRPDEFSHLRPFGLGVRSGDLHGIRVLEPADHRRPTSIRAGWNNPSRGHILQEIAARLESANLLCIL